MASRSGSPRPTSGRKRRHPVPWQASSVTARPVTPPADLTVAERARWDRFAPAALRLGTLTDETIEGFRLLCNVAVLRDEAAAVLAAEGLTVQAPNGDIKAHPVSVHVRQLTQRLEALMARFLLTAPGRAVDVPKTSSKWDILTRPIPGRDRRAG